MYNQESVLYLLSEGLIAEANLTGVVRKTTPEASKGADDASAPKRYRRRLLKSSLGLKDSEVQGLRNSGAYSWVTGLQLQEKTVPCTAYRERLRILWGGGEAQG